MTTDLSVTQSEFREDSELNALIKRFHTPEQIPYEARRAVYGDFSSLDSYQDAIERVRAADDAFDELPSEVRSAFDNDPANLIGVLDAVDQGNHQAARDLEQLGFQGLSPASSLASPTQPAPAEGPVSPTPSPAEAHRAVPTPAEGGGPENPGEPQKATQQFSG